MPDMTYFSPKERYHNMNQVSLTKRLASIALTLLGFATLIALLLFAMEQTLILGLHGSAGTPVQEEYQSLR